MTRTPGTSRTLGLQGRDNRRGREHASVLLMSICGQDVEHLQVFVKYWAEETRCPLVASSSLQGRTSVLLCRSRTSIGEKKSSDVTSPFLTFRSHAQGKVCATRRNMNAHENTGRAVKQNQTRKVHEEVSFDSYKISYSHTHTKGIVVAILHNTA